MGPQKIKGAPTTQAGPVRLYVKFEFLKSYKIYN